MRKCKASDQARGETFRSVPFTPFLSLLLYLSEWGEIYLSIIFWCLFSHLSVVSSTLGLLLFSRPSLSLVSLALSLSPFLSHLSSCCGFWALSSPVTLSDSLQMDVVSAFQSGSSFQERQLRRQPSTSSQQQHDVTNVSSPTHVAFSTTATDANTASSTVGCECVFP